MSAALGRISTRNFRPSAAFEFLGGCNLREETLIIIMTTNPEPRHCVTFQDPKCPIAPRYPHRPNSLFTVDTLEMQRRVERVLFPQPIRFPCTLPNFVTQLSMLSPKGGQNC